MDELKTYLEIAGILISAIAAIFLCGRWFGTKHQELVGKIAAVKNMLKKHIEDDAPILQRIEKKQREHSIAITDLKKVCANGVPR